MSRKVTIKWSDHSVTGRWSRPREPSGPAILLAHGAGTDQDHRSIATLRDGLAELGHPVLTFNYPYREAGRGRPDRKERLLECHRAAHHWLVSKFDTVFLAGRSMGGRMATYLAAEGLEVGGLVLYSYPLHPAGQPQSLRADHLPEVAAPMLFFTGSRDALAEPSLVDMWIRPLAGSTLEVIDEADHSLRVPKRTGWSEQSLTEWLIDRTSRWVKAQ